MTRLTMAAFAAFLMMPMHLSLAQDHSAHEAMQHMQATAEKMAVSANDPAGNELMSVMTKMHENMNVPLTGDPDADFIRGMIPHHQGAIDMATIVLKYGDDPETRALAQNIIRAQKGEIAMMKRWLAKRQIPERDAINLKK